MVQLLRAPFQQVDELLALIADGVGQFLGLLQKIVADFALGLRFVIFDLADFFRMEVEATERSEVKRAWLCERSSRSTFRRLPGPRVLCERTPPALLQRGV